MILPDLEELSISRVFERGIPNKECVAISVNQNTNMGQYGLMLGIAETQQTAIPLHHQLYWFGDGLVQRGDWIFLYTGAGTPQTRVLVVGGIAKSYTCFWGKPSTAFANSQVVPILFKIGALDVHAQPADKLQLGLDYSSNT